MAPDLSWLTPGLALAGRFKAGDIAHLAGVLRVRAVVDLRAEACDDELLLRRHGVSFLHLPTADHCAVSQPMLRRGVAFVTPHLEAGRRVLIHCEHGIGRAPTLALCVLVSGGMEPLAALMLAKSRRPLVSPSPAQYEAWAQWLRERTTRGPAGWAVPDFDAFQAIAYADPRLRTGRC